jgi:hypothetical protein
VVVDGYKRIMLVIVDWVGIAVVIIVGPLGIMGAFATSRMKLVRLQVAHQCNKVALV